MDAWNDVVFCDTVGVEGKTLDAALLDFWTENGWHDTGDVPCSCAACQVFAPMAIKLDAGGRDTMKAVLIPNYHDAGSTAIPLDNISYVTQGEGVTRIYLRQVAGASMLFYILTALSVEDVFGLLSAAD